MSVQKKPDVYVLIMTDKSGGLTTCVFDSWEKCISQIKEEFKNLDEKFTEEIEREFNEQEYYETPKMRYRIDVCTIN